MEMNLRQGRKWTDYILLADEFHQKVFIVRSYFKKNKKISHLVTTLVQGCATLTSVRFQVDLCLKILHIYTTCGLN